MTTAIQLADVWKAFRIPHQKRTTILERAADILSLFEGKRFTYEEFWALSEVTFQVQQGESIGIIGDNGSGKTTLLRVIAKILRPDKGEVKTHGRIAPMLELGVGFHPDLTVKENIAVFGSIMGLTNQELRGKSADIITFSGLQRFGDARLRNLSSGMQIRLAFSIAIETNPEIFLIDEALAVGDLEFRAKCIERFERFKKEGKTIVLVSHDLALVQSFCQRAMLLSEGKIIAEGASDEIARKYASIVHGAS